MSITQLHPFLFCAEILCIDYTASNKMLLIRKWFKVETKSKDSSLELLHYLTTVSVQGRVAWGILRCISQGSPVIACIYKKKTPQSLHLVQSCSWKQAPLCCIISFTTNGNNNHNGGSVLLFSSPATLHNVLKMQVRKVTIRNVFPPAVPAIKQPA